MAVRGNKFWSSIPRLSNKFLVQQLHVKSDIVAAVPRHNLDHIVGSNSSLAASDVIYENKSCLFYNLLTLR